MSEDLSPDLLDPNNPPVPMRKEYSDEFLRKLGQALELTKGNRNHAILLLGLDKEFGMAKAVSRVREAIRSTPWLAMKWTVGAKTALDPHDPNDIDRPFPLIAPDKEKLAEAVSRQDKLISTGLEKLGFSAKDVDFVKAIQTQYTGNLQQTLDLTYGAAVHSTVEMTLALSKLKSQLADIDANPERYVLTAMTKTGDEYIVKDAHAYRMEVYDRMTRVADLLRKMNSSVNEATKTRLVADKIRRELAQGDKGPQAVAGWDVEVDAEEGKK